MDLFWIIVCVILGSYLGVALLCFLVFLGLEGLMRDTNHLGSKVKQFPYLELFELSIAWLPLIVMVIVSGMKQLISRLFRPGVQAAPPPH